MSGTGRKLDIIWTHFHRSKPEGKSFYTAKCKECKCEMPGLVERLRKHVQNCKGGGSAERGDSDSDVEVLPAEQPGPSQSGM